MIQLLISFGSLCFALGVLVATCSTSRKPKGFGAEIRQLLELAEILASLSSSVARKDD